MADDSKTEPAAAADKSTAVPEKKGASESPSKPVEIGGPEGPEPTRYGDWEKKGRCVDF